MPYCRLLLQILILPVWALVRQWGHILKWQVMQILFIDCFGMQEFISSWYLCYVLISVPGPEKLVRSTNTYWDAQSLGFDSDISALGRSKSHCTNWHDEIMGWNLGRSSRVSSFAKCRMVLDIVVVLPCSDCKALSRYSPAQTLFYHGVSFKFTFCRNPKCPKLILLYRTVEITAITCKVLAPTAIANMHSCAIQCDQDINLNELMLHSMVPNARRIES